MLLTLFALPLNYRQNAKKNKDRGESSKKNKLIIKLKEKKTLWAWK